MLQEFGKERNGKVVNELLITKDVIDWVYVLGMHQTNWSYKVGNYSEWHPRQLVDHKGWQSANSIYDDDVAEENNDNMIPDLIPVLITDPIPLIVNNKPTCNLL